MSPDFQEISARLLALETVVGQLVTRLAVRADDPASWLATRKVLALQAAHSVGEDAGAHELAAAMQDAIAEFFAGVEDVLFPSYGGRGLSDQRKSPLA